MAKTSIEWATKVWNPLRGCSKVSEGCRNCYAVRQAHRFSGPGMPYEGLTRATDQGLRWTGKVTLVPDMLEHPLQWKRPERIFVNSMSDLFHPEVPFDYIDQVFAVMALCKHHTFQILTKRPRRMLEYFAANEMRWNKLVDIAPYMEKWGWISPEDAANIAPPGSVLPKWPEWPIPNVWLGVSVENQRTADERIPLLLQTPAAVRFLSCEPLLGSVNVQPWIRKDWVEWVIVGGESGPGARPMHPDWVRGIRDQCQAAGVPFFFKQWGEWSPGYNQSYERLSDSREYTFDDSMTVWRVGKKAAGRQLDGREWNEFPEVQA